MQTSEEQHDHQHLNTLLSKLRPFQRKAFDFAVNGVIPEEENKRQKKRPPHNTSGQQNHVAGAGTGRILLGDEMGLGEFDGHRSLSLFFRKMKVVLTHSRDYLGKTISSLAIMSAYQQTEWPLLILCPASLRYTWPAEIEKFLPWISSQSTHVVRGADDVTFAQKIVNWRRKKAELNKPTLKPPYQIVICTYSLLQNRYAVSKALQNCNFECVIADESHNLKQKDSQRCKLALPIMKQSKRLVLLSGTPALNRPVELYPQLNALDPTGKMFPGSGNMSYTQYTKRYCNAKQTRFGYDVKGISNPEELHQCLKKVMLRRLKSQVLQDLPSKQRSIVPVEMKDKDKAQDSRYVMEDWSAACKALDGISDLDADDVARAANHESRRAMMQAYQASGIAKASAVAEYIIDWLRGCDSSQKLVVFAHHKDVMDCLQDAISKEFKGRLGMIRIDGSVSPLERASRVKQFQTNKGVRLALLSMTAAGVGLTLTAASNIIFAELHWTPGVLVQAEDRCHRIGQANSVNVTYCVCKDGDLSIDMTIWKMLTNKTGNLSKIVDGERKGMDAVETSMALNNVGEGSNSGVSAEADLVNFFTSTKSTQSAKANTGPPVKGTIQSFFKKQAAAKDSSNAPSTARKLKSDGKTRSLDGKTSPNSVAVACISLLDNNEVASFVNCPACTFQNNADATVCAMCSSPIAGVSCKPTAHEQIQEQEWACSACTFANKNDLLVCEVCGTDRQNELGAFHLPDQSESSDESESDESVSSFDDNRKQASSDINAYRDSHIDSVDTKGIGPLHLPDQLSSSSDDSDESVASNFVNQKHCNMERKSPTPSFSQNSTSVASECIDLTQEDESQEKKPQHTKKPRRDDKPSILSFSVSKNSGRIALHLNSSGEPLHVNFDISQVVTQECSNHMQEVTLSRKSPKKQAVLQFDDRGIRRVLSELDGCSLLSSSTLSQLNFQSKMIDELKLFVTCYLNLREIEKKAVKDSGETIAASALGRTAASLLHSTVSGSTDRYSTGSQALGAKERAIENHKNNVATDQDKLVLQKLACAWCAAPFQTQNLTVDVDATYCSWKCAEEGRVRRGNMFSSTKIRASLFELER
jgi:SWI/SNF-related matrix-associated actin-dependent regulator 1 of chromatin subfamily A